MRGLQIKVEQVSDDYFWDITFKDRDGKEKEFSGVNDSVFAVLADVRTLLMPRLPKRNAMLRNGIFVGSDFILTEKERETLMMLIDGMTYSQIALEAHRTTQTIKNRMQRARKRLNCETNSQLIYTALYVGELP